MQGRTMGNGVLHRGAIFLVLILAAFGVAPAAAANAGLACFYGQLRSKAHDKYYVSVELDYTGSSYGMLRARSFDGKGEWEQLEMCRLGGNKVAFHSTANGKYVSAERDYVGTNMGMLRARATSIGDWETFYEECNAPGADDWCAYKSKATGYYVSAEIQNTGSNYGMLRARGISIADWEMFHYYYGKP
ncbi:hypothetical protein [Actinoplanes palleronii]